MNRSLGRPRSGLWNEKTAYLLKKLVQLALVLFLLSLAVFVIARLCPGDPLKAWYGDGVEHMSQAQQEAARNKLGLNDSILVQYRRWVGQVLQGDLGISYKYKQPVAEIIGKLWKNTLILGGLAYVLTFVLSIGLGIFCALREDRLIDRIICKVGVVSSSIPSFFLALLLILIFAVNLGWLPVGGAYDYGQADDAVNRLVHLILPVTVLVLEHLWYYAYMVRNKLVEEARQDYVLLCKAKGFSRRKIISRSCMRNVMPSMLVIMAISVPHILGGTYVVETVFAYPGLGTLSFESAMYQDYNMLMALCMLTGVVVVVFNVLAQILGEWIDPRMQYVQVLDDEAAVSPAAAALAALSPSASSSAAASESASVTSASGMPGEEAEAPLSPLPAATSVSSAAASAPVSPAPASSAAVTSAPAFAEKSIASAAFMPDHGEPSSSADCADHADHTCHADHAGYADHESDAAHADYEAACGAVQRGKGKKHPGHARTMKQGRRLPYGAIVLLVLIAAGCLLAGALAPYPPDLMDSSAVNEAPSLAHLLGTDSMGRDLLTMILYGGRASLYIGVLSGALSTIIAVVYGCISGLASERISDLMMRFAELIMSVPSILLILFLQAIWGTPSATSIAVIIAVTSWMNISKIVRSEVRQIGASDYILAAKTMDADFGYILRRHLLPNFISSIMFMVVTNIGQAMITESTLSFLGLGLPLTTVSWGSLLSMSQNVLLTGCWWIILLPGAVLIATLVCITEIGEFIRRKNNRLYSNL